MNKAGTPSARTIEERFFRDWVRVRSGRVPPRRSSIAGEGGHGSPDAALTIVLPFAGAEIQHSSADEGSRSWRPSPLLSVLTEPLSGPALQPRPIRLILSEEDPGLVDRLAVTLGIPDADRAWSESGNPADLHRQIWIYGGAFAQLVAEIGEWKGTADELLVLCAPSSPSALPLSVVQQLADTGRADLLIHFPRRTLRRLRPYQHLPIADLPPIAREALNGYSAFFGDPRHGWLKEWRAAERNGTTPGAERQLATRYHAALRRAAPGAIARHVGLDPVSADGTSADIFLLTSRPDVSLLLNRAVRAARIRAEIAWPQSSGGIVTEEPAGELQLFAANDVNATGGSSTRVRRIDLPAVAHRLMERFRGEVVPFREVVRELAETELFLEEVRRTLSSLKRDRRIRYQSLREESLVDFRGGAIHPPRRNRRRDQATLPIVFPGNVPRLS